MPSKQAFQAARRIVADGTMYIVPPHLIGKAAETTEFAPLREMAEKLAALQDSRCWCKCGTHGYGCGLDEATCQPPDNKCSRCKLLARARELGIGTERAIRRNQEEHLKALTTGEGMGISVRQMAENIDAEFDDLRQCLRVTAEMLQMALAECSEHNRDYHNHTAPVRLAEWRDQADKALALAGGDK